MNVKTVRNGEETQIILFVLVPECKSCRDRIESYLVKTGVWDRVEVGYRMREGSPVILSYREREGVDYWRQAQNVKKWLDDNGYRVL